MLDFLNTLKTSRLYWNVISNGTVKIWSACLNIIAIPIIVKELGAEAYGLVGLYGAIEVIFTFLDLGLSATVNREISINLAKGKTDRENKNLLRTFEFFYWIIGICVAFFITLGADWISKNWVVIKELTVSQVKYSIYLMALLFAARWPISLYTGVFRGLQKQYLVNLITITMVTLKIIGAIVILSYITNRVVDYIIWQAVISSLEVILLYIFSWRELSKFSSGRPQIDLSILRGIWRFALSFNLVGIFGMILSQADRLVASKYVNLSEIGYYSLGTTAAGSLTLISYSISTAIFPRFSGDSAKNFLQQIRLDFHRAGGVINYLSFGFGFLLIFYPSNILYIWTADEVIIKNTSLLLLILALAYLLNSMSNPSYTLLIASGNTKVPLICNFVNLIIFIPLLLIFVPKWGILVAAVSWFLQNIISFFIYAIMVNKLVLKEPFIKYVYTDVFPYFLISLLIISISKAINLYIVDSILQLTVGIVCTVFYFILFFPRTIRAISPLAQKGNP